MKGRTTGSHRAVYRLCGLHKIHFGIHEKAFASRFHDRKTGAALVAEFASWHVWFCRECESESEERFGRAALSRALSAPRFAEAAPVEVLNDMLKWSDSAFFGDSRLLVHHCFCSREGGHHWTNCIGEGSNAALKAQRTGVKGADGIHTMARLSSLVHRTRTCSSPGVNPPFGSFAHALVFIIGLDIICSCFPLFSRVCILV